MAERGRVTYADLAAIPDDGVRRELLDGELIVAPSPKVRHQVLVGRMFLFLAEHVRERSGAQVLLAPLDVYLDESNVVQPDLVVVLDSQREIVAEDNIRGVPALLIEIVSQSRMDRVRKRDAYARFGVPGYWIVDPDADRIEVYRLGPHGYGKPEILEPGDELVVDALPGLRLDVSDLFRP